MLSAFLKKPYPYIGDLKKAVVSNLFIGLFVALFLIIFEPFDTNLWQTANKTLKLAGFGFISFVVPTLVIVLMAKFTNAFNGGEKWNIGKEMAVILLILLLIALGNMLYSHLLGLVDLSLRNYLAALTVTLILGVFPVTFHVVRKHNKLLKINLQRSQQLNEELAQRSALPTATEPLRQEAGGDKPVHLVADNEKHDFKLETKDLLYIESADNYCCVVYQLDGKPKKELIRSSLKRIETQLDQQYIIRCHRTYIVNLVRVKKVEGNAAGYRLILDTGDLVPVSRSYIPLVNEKLKPK